MPQRYRLHLSDGTVLVVDHDSLNTWLVDPKAMVQLEGSNLWLPLRKFLAAEREAAFRAAPRRTAKTREELPLIPPPPRKGARQTPPPEPAVPEPAVPEPGVPEPTPPEPVKPEATQPEPAQPELTQPEPAKPEPPILEPARPTPPPARPEMPLVPPPSRQAERLPPPPALVAPEPAKLVAVAVTPPAPPREEPAHWTPPTPPPPKPTPPREPEPIEQPPSDFTELLDEPIGEPAGVEPVAAGPVVPQRRPLSRPVARPDESISPIPLVPLEDTPLTPAIPLAREKSRGVRPGPHPLAADVFADEERSQVVADTYGQDLPVIPLKPLPDEGRGRGSAWSESEEMPAGALDEGFDDRFGAEREAEGGLRHADVVFLRVMATFGGLLSRLLDSLVRYGRQQRARRAARSAPSVARVAEAPRPTVPPRVAAALQSLGELLSAGIAKVGAMRQGQPADKEQSFGELLASAAPKPAPRSKAVQEPRAPEVLPAAAEVWVPEASPAAEPWQAADTTRPDTEPRPRPSARAGSDFAAPPGPVVPAPAAPQRPPAISDLPVLRLREIPKADEDEGDLYDGDYEYPGEESAVARVLRRLGLWVQRLILVALLVAGGTWAALNWRHWFPRAGEVGQKALATIDQQVRSVETQKQQAQALQAGVEQMPQLAPETIQLVLSRSSSLEVTDLFEAASEAADRGGASLSREEGLELAALRDELLSGLDVPERERIGDYERARSIGVVSASEERTALTLVARGARALPPERLARLQTLLGKAIAAGLPQPSPAATP